ncbi:MAG: hypothetical protein WBJ21_03045, partial [Burkholderiaceae bacterium]
FSVCNERRWIPLRATSRLASRDASAGVTHASRNPCLTLRRERSGEFGLHAVCPRSSHHMQVMTVGILIAPQPLPSSR